MNKRIIVFGAALAACLGAMLALGACSIEPPVAGEGQGESLGTAQDGRSLQEFDWASLGIEAGKFLIEEALKSNAENAACNKILCMIDPNYATEQGVERIKEQVLAIDDKVREIGNEIKNLHTEFDGLAKQLAIDTKEIEFDNKENLLYEHVYRIRDDWESLYTRGPYPKNAQEGENFVNDVLSSARADNLVGHLGMIHQAIIDMDSTGLFAKVYQLQKAKFAPLRADDPYSGLPASPADYEMGYAFIESFFCRLFAEQAKAVAVISACYKYYDRQGATFTTKPSLKHTKFEDFKAAFDLQIAAQTDLFQQTVEKYVAMAINMNWRPGLTSAWVSQVFLRADLVAAWARASSTATPQRTRVVRVIGEPDRVALLEAQGGIKEKASGRAIPIDTTPLGPANQPEKLRTWPVRGPYLQYPYSKNDWDRGITWYSVKGAASICIAKYVLADTSTESGAVELIAPGVKSRVGPFTMDVAYYDGTGGKQPGPSSKVSTMLFGHYTHFLKGELVYNGLWSDTRSSFVNDSRTTVHQPDARSGSSYPQWGQVAGDIDPTVESVQQKDRWRSWYQYYCRGEASLSVWNPVLLYFEGWGDIPDEVAKNLTPKLSLHRANSSFKLYQNGDNGSHNGSVFLQGVNGESLDPALVKTANYDSTDPVLTLDDTRKANWQAGQTLGYALGVKLYCKWDATRSSDPYGSSTFAGTLNYQLDNIVLHFGATE